MTMTPEQLVHQAKRFATRAPSRSDDSSFDRLNSFIEGVENGTIYAVEWPWPCVHQLTQALIPGTITAMCGDPGAGKTYLLLDCLRYWISQKVDASIFFLEKNREFYDRRLLAQQEGRSCFTEFKWIQKHPSEYRESLHKHRKDLDTIGAHITTTETFQKPLTPRNLHGWVRDELLSGKRVLAIDPITANDSGAEPWNEDKWFMKETQKLLGQHGGSLILVTHPVKSSTTKPSGHSMAGGAAYFRLADTSLWVVRMKERKRFEVLNSAGTTSVNTENVIEIHKARDSRGTGQRIAMGFGDGLHFSEYGVIVSESKLDPGESQATAYVADPFAPKPRADTGFDPLEDL